MVLGRLRAGLGQAEGRFRVGVVVRDRAWLHIQLSALETEPRRFQALNACAGVTRARRPRCQAFGSTDGTRSSLASSSSAAESLLVPRNEKTGN